MTKRLKARLPGKCEASGCGKQFPIYRPNQRFCSAKCRARDHAQHLRAGLRELRESGALNKIVSDALGVPAIPFPGFRRENSDRFLKPVSGRLAIVRDSSPEKFRFTRVEVGNPSFYRHPADYEAEIAALKTRLDERQTELLAANSVLVKINRALKWALRESYPFFRDEYDGAGYRQEEFALCRKIHEDDFSAETLDAVTKMQEG